MGLPAGSCLPCGFLRCKYLNWMVTRVMLTNLTFSQWKHSPYASHWLVFSQERMCFPHDKAAMSAACIKLISWTLKEPELICYKSTWNISKKLGNGPIDTTHHALLYSDRVNVVQYSMFLCVFVPRVRYKLCFVALVENR
jgi:hypothetical protein